MVDMYFSSIKRKEIPIFDIFINEQPSSDRWQPVDIWLGVQRISPNFQKVNFSVQIQFGKDKIKSIALNQ